MQGADAENVTNLPFNGSCDDTAIVHPIWRWQGRVLKEEERAKLDALKDRLHDLPEARESDHLLIRYLIARDFKIDATEERIRLALSRFRCGVMLSGGTLTPPIQVKKSGWTLLTTLASTRSNDILSISAAWLL